MLSWFPTDIVENITLFLPLQDAISVVSTCQEFHRNSAEKVIPIVLTIQFENEEGGANNDRIHRIEEEEEIVSVENNKKRCTVKQMYTKMINYGKDRNSHVIKWFAKAGINVNDAIPENNDRSKLELPLAIVSLKGYLSYVKVLIAAGADINKKNNQSSDDIKSSSLLYYGWYPIHRAVISNNYNIVKVLLDATDGRPADFVNKKDNSGKTALHYARDEAIKSMLIAAGAKTGEGYTDIGVSDFSKFMFIYKLINCQ